MRVLPLLACAAFAVGADSVPVTGVTEAGRIAVDWRGVPVSFELALVELPEGDARRAALDEVKRLANGKQVEVQFSTAYGTDALGIGRVLVKVGTVDVSTVLAEKGLVRHRPATGSPAADKLVALAQGRAQKAKAGVWAAPAAAATTPAATATATAVATAAKPAAEPAKTGFVAELNGKFYYPAGHASVAGVHPDRLIRYASEEQARKAGKLADPGAGLAIAEGNDESSADRNHALGQELLAKALGMPATPERDAVYTAALVPLTRAMQVYQSLAERSPSDAKLGEKLRAARADRYTATKYRRV